MFSAAPRPRPPQPITPTLIVSLPLAKAFGTRFRAAVPAVTTEVVLRNSRRVGDDFGSVMIDVSWKESQIPTGSTRGLPLDDEGANSLEILLLFERPDDPEPN